MNMKRVNYSKYPWWLIIKFYWFRLTVVSLIWFIYDFSVYSLELSILSLLVKSYQMELFTKIGVVSCVQFVLYARAFLGAL